MDLLLASPAFTIEFDMMHVIAYRSSTFSTGDVAAACDLISGILDQLPEYVRRQQSAP